FIPLLGRIDDAFAMVMLVLAGVGIAAVLGRERLFVMGFSNFASSSSTPKLSWTFGTARGFFLLFFSYKLNLVVSTSLSLSFSLSVALSLSLSLALSLCRCA